MQNGRTMSPRPKAHLWQMNLQWGQKQRGMAKSGYDHHITEFGGNLKVNKSSFVEAADLFWVVLDIIISRNNSRYSTGLSESWLMPNNVYSSYG